MTVHTGTVAPVRIAGHAVASDLAEVRNPAHTSRVVGTVAMATGDHVDAAVEAARAAGPAWAGTPASVRAEYLGKAVERLLPEVGRLATLLTCEQGKVLCEATSDVAGAAAILRYYSGLVDELEPDRLFREDDRGAVWTGRRPMGVTGVIVPWNSPVYLGFLAIAPALLAGNTVVVKPSELAPLTLCEVAAIVADCLPEGVLSVVPGGADAGRAIAAHPQIRKVFFTGSTATGRSIMRDAAGNLKRLSLELGGNDPAIVLESAAIDDRLIKELVQGAFAISGQVCFSVKRIYVHRSRFDDFVDRYVAALDEIVVGDGLEAGVSMGPLNNRAQLDRVEGLLKKAVDCGATVRTVGRKHDPGAWDEGYFLLPSVVTDIAPSAPLVVEEQFGPAVPVMPFDDEDEVIRLANDSEFGLAASVWTTDHAHAVDLARRIESGTVFVNAHRAGASDVSMPFGGFKSSGVGRMHGVAALHACTELQAIALWRDTSGFPRSLSVGGS